MGSIERIKEGIWLEPSRGIFTVVGKGIVESSLREVNGSIERKPLSVSRDPVQRDGEGKTEWNEKTVECS